MNIAQISDIHIDKEGEILHGVDVRANFIRVLDSIEQYPVDAIVISGDLCYREPSQSIYEWIKDTLIKKGIPYFLLPGNHDDPKLMSEIFERSLMNKRYDYFVDSAGTGMLFLDTSDGMLHKPQLSYTSYIAENQKAEILFMHHPPVLGLSHYMDKNYPLSNNADFLCKIRNSSIRHIFCGHYHIDKSAYYKDFAVHICPSSWYQIDDRSDNFSVLSHSYGWRFIEVSKSSLSHRVVWL